LITGASRGLGRCIALTFADEGAFVYAGYRARDDDAAETARQLGGRGETLRFDVSQAVAVDAAVAKIRAARGRLDFVINNAAKVFDGPAALMNPAQWREVLETNLDGAFNCTRAALPLMLAAKSGVVVNVASVAGIKGTPGQANYAASKGGLLALTRSLAVELAPMGIRVNAVVPGMLDAGMAHHLDRQILSRVIEATPLGRLGRAEEVAAAVLFLCSEEAAFIVGQALVVDGGLTA
jgi:3-oxoacyl-[acyl-carrier protein] reductase